MDTSAALAAQYLTNKAINLSAPGTRLNTLYYDTPTITVEDVECGFYFGKYNTSLGSVLFNSSGTCSIPNASFLGSCLLSLTLPNTNANVYAARGWGYSMIHNIQYNFGSSNSPNLTIFGESLWQMVCAQGLTAEKRDELLRLGGEQINGATTRPTAAIYLVLPWSNVSGNKIPFDTNLLNQPIQITVTFKPGASVFGGTGTPPTQFSSVRLITRMGDLTQKDLSVRMKMLATPGMYLGYPFIYTQGQPGISFTGAQYPNSVSVQLTGFQWGDLLAITFYAVRQDYVRPTSPDIPNPLALDNLSDIQAVLNGNVIYYAEGYSHKLISGDQLPGAAYYRQVLLGPAGGGVPLAAGLDCYPVCIDFSQKKGYVFHDTFQNTPRIPQQPIQLTFSTETTNSYYLYVTYYYNCLNSVTVGTSTISL